MGRLRCGIDVFARMIIPTGRIAGWQGMNVAVKPLHANPLRVTACVLVDTRVVTIARRVLRRG